LRTPVAMMGGSELGPSSAPQFGSLPAYCDTRPVTGSTYGPTVGALDLLQRQAVFSAIEEQADGHPPVIMKAVLGHAVAV
jgi:hypothetical protein